jgi:tryptophanyl-tRNA synthetase (EC 6.1.1.2)
VDEPDEIRWAIKRAVTDTVGVIGFSNDPARAGVNNLLQIYELFTGQSRAEIEAHFAGKGYGALKAEVTEVVIEGLRPIRERYHQLIDEPAELDRILAIGAEQARAVAEPKILAGEGAHGLRAAGVGMLNATCYMQHCACGASAPFGM